MTLKTSALIIGGGPAGSTAARFLSEAGVDTLLAERDFSYVKPCGGCIPSGGFNEFGLPEALIKKKIGRIVIVAPSGKRLEINLRGGHLYITERGSFDSALRTLAGQKGASLIECEFTGVEKRNGSFVSRLIRKADGAIITVHSDYLLAADGISFITGKCLNMKRPSHLYTISANIPRFEGDACEFWFGNKHASNFYSWIFPSEGRASIGTGGSAPGELRPLFDNFIKRRFGNNRGPFAGNRDICHPRIFPVPSWRGSPYSDGNALFLGDAAGMVMPTTYEGIYYAMKSGQLAADAIIDGRPDYYRALLEDKFRYRFILMKLFRKLCFRNDLSIEKWVGIHGNPEIQEIAMSLWLRKQADSRGLFEYLRAFTGGHLF
jgi:geranylgeranyl diphosphate/geranylgeranyl-bacteriochlorophyllide a reductase